MLLLMLFLLRVALAIASVRGSFIESRPHAVLAASTCCCYRQQLSASTCMYDARAIWFTYDAASSQ
jgi:hypothetical protein